MRPSARHLIQRHRLFAHLDVRTSLTWLWGPPGSGKTSLVATYLQARRLRAMWYRLQADDADGGAHSTPMAELAAHALDAAVETAYVQRLVRMCRLTPREPPVHLETWPWPVKIFALGRFDVLIGDEPVRFAGKAQKKPLALLQALVAFGGRNVDEERLAEVLWPDSDGDAAHQALTVTLHRLRRLLRHDDGISRCYASFEGSRASRRVSGIGKRPSSHTNVPLRSINSRKTCISA